MTLKHVVGGLAMFAVASASLLLVAGDASAAWIAREQFNYGVGAAPGAGGLGWATGAWTANGAVVVGPGLSFPGMPFAGNALGGTPGSAATRMLTSPVPGTGGFILMQVLIKANNNGTPGTQATFGNVNGVPDGHFIVGDLPQFEAEAANWGIQNGASRCYSDDPVIGGTTTLLVARIDFDSSTYNDRQRLWVNPPTPFTPASLLSVPTDIDVTNYNINQVAGVFWQTQSSQGELDEISIFTGPIANFTGVPVNSGVCY